jgi:hypothetical protein
VTRFPGAIAWPGSHHVPDLRRRPQLAALAALHAAVGITVHALIAAHPEMGRPASRHTDRTSLARGILGSVDELLIVVAHYEQAITEAPRPASVGNVGADERRWEQLPLPFPGWPVPAAHERARGAAGEGAR